MKVLKLLCMKEGSQSGRTDAHGLWTGLPTQVGVLALSCGGQSNSCGAAQWEWVGLLSVRPRPFSVT